MTDGNDVLCVYSRFKGTLISPSMTTEVINMAYYNAHGSDRIDLDSLDIQGKDGCNIFEFELNLLGTSVSSEITLTQNYDIPLCLSIPITNTNESVVNIETLKSNNIGYTEYCNVVKYDTNSVVCGCTKTNNMYLLIGIDEFDLEYSAATASAVNSFTVGNLSDHPTAFIMLDILFFIFIIGFWCIMFIKKDDKPLLAIADIVFKLLFVAFFFVLMCFFFTLMCVLFWCFVLRKGRHTHTHTHTHTRARNVS